MADCEKAKLSLQPLPVVMMYMKVLVSKHPVGSLQFTQQVFHKGTPISPTHPTQTPSQTAANNITQLYIDKALAIILIRRVLLNGELTNEKVRLDSANISLN